MHKEEADDRSGGVCDLGFRNSNFSANDKVVKKLNGAYDICNYQYCSILSVIVICHLIIHLATAECDPVQLDMIGGLRMEVRLGDDMVIVPLIL